MLYRLLLILSKLLRIIFTIRKKNIDFFREKILSQKIKKIGLKVDKKEIFEN